MSDAFYGAAIPGFVTIVIALIGVWKSMQNGNDINAVHTIVNSERSAMRVEIDSLRKLVELSIRRDLPVTAQQSEAIKPAEMKSTPSP